MLSEFDFAFDAIDDDRREDARLEEATDAFDAKALTCPYDGVRWDPGFHPATRVDPSYEEHPECPVCGMGVEEAQELVDGDEPYKCPDCGGAGIRSEAEAQRVAERDNLRVEQARGYCGTCEASGLIPPFGEMS